MGQVLDIQKFSLHDGEGIRTTIFLKGCNMKCLWCHNPESISIKKNIVFTANKCISCKACFKVCKNNALYLKGNERVYVKELCKLCGECISVCPTGAISFDCKEMTVDEVMESVLSDRLYYENSNGGVTISGGEPQMQLDCTIEILSRCKAEGINTAIESNISFNKENIDKMLPYLDYFFCDLKVFDNEEHIKKTGIPNTKILENIKYLSTKPIQVTVRTPIIPNINDSIENLEQIAAFLKNNAPNVKYELLNYNPFTESKYDRINEEFSIAGTKPKTENEMRFILNRLKEINPKTFYKEN